ncbi:MAG: type II toxin-antitoxin system VapC family toxin [Chloroflexota bacterium]|nr:type II toxin-antitoxin system VapC family toxin [Chloroflexota bacterium]
MIIDTSAIVAILRDEVEAPAFLRAIREARPRRLSAASYVEIGIVIDRSPDPVVRAAVDDLLRRLNIRIEPVTPEQARIARSAYASFGRTSGHPARLNFGDCFAYALAKDVGESLLFKGDDFARTDIPLVGSRAEQRRLSELLAAYG